MDRPQIPPRKFLTVSAEHHAALLAYAIEHNVRLRDLTDKIIAEWRIRTEMAKGENRG